MKRCLSAVALAASVLLAAGNAQAQTTPAPVLPPALMAAVQSGNEAAIDNAIATLSGGDAAKAGALSVAVIATAERMLATNPKLAVEVAAAAVQSVKNAGAAQASSANAQTVITTAARIFINPAAEQAVPDLVGQLATATMNAAVASNNAALAGTVANQAVSTAEKILAVDPATAVQLATAAVGVVKQAAIEQAEPQDAVSVLATAKRIMLNPDAEQAVPLLIQQLAAATGSQSDPTKTQPVITEQKQPDASPS